MNNNQTPEYKAGRIAQTSAAIKASNCPYLRGTREYTLWMEGFTSTESNWDKMEMAQREQINMWGRIAASANRIDNEEDDDPTGNKAGWPSTTGNPSGGGRDNNSSGRGLR